MTTHGVARISDLVEQHYAGLYRFAYRLSGCAHEAADLVQETFCKAQTNWHQLRRMESAKAWLYSILRNQYLLRLRDRRRHMASELEDLAQPAPSAASPEWPGIEPERLQAALNTLPEDFRTPLILFYFEEFSYKEIADHMAIPMGTVMSRLARGKSHLRQFLLTAPSPAKPTATARVES